LSSKNPEKNKNILLYWAILKIFPANINKSENIF